MGSKVSKTDFLRLLKKYCIVTVDQLQVYIDRYGGMYKFHLKLIEYEQSE